MPDPSLNPHPADVIGMPRPSWARFGRMLPTFDKVVAHMTAQGKAWTEQDDAAWRASIEATKPTRKVAQPGSGVTAGVPASAAAADPAPPQAPLRHRQAKPEKVDMEVMSVRVREGIGERLDLYRVHLRSSMGMRVSKQDIVSDALDDFLTREGF